MKPVEATRQKLIDAEKDRCEERMKPGQDIRECTGCVRLYNQCAVDEKDGQCRPCQLLDAKRDQRQQEGQTQRTRWQHEMRPRKIVHYQDDSTDSEDGTGEKGKLQLVDLDDLPRLIRTKNS